MDPLSLFAIIAFGIADADGTLGMLEEEELAFDDDNLLAFGDKNGAKLWRSPGVPTDGSAVPLFILVHGILPGPLRHPWLNPHPINTEWDARIFVSDLVRREKVAPLVVAVPNQTVALGDP